jgi:hypothetical protein
MSDQLEKVVKRGGFGLFQITITALISRDRAEPRKTSVRMVHIPAEIQARHLPSRIGIQLFIA